MAEPCDLTAIEALSAIAARTLSPVELLDSCIARTEATNGAVNAMVAMDAEAARKRALQIEQAIGRGEEVGLLAGLPIGVKDLQATAGLRTTWGSLLFKDHVPAKDEASVARTRAAGGVILGKTNTPEFGAGANTVNRVYGATGNPFDPAKTCAGSSGGSAVALALGQVPLATGSDYGGSLRTPAAFCGVAGFRPSPGVVATVDRPVSLNPFSVTGPMGRTIADAHLLLRAQVAIDKSDVFSPSAIEPLPAKLNAAELGTLRAAFSVDLGCAPVDSRIAALFKERAGGFRHVFREVEERAPDFSGVHEVFEVLRGVNFVAAHKERLERSRDLLGPNVIDNTERGLAYSLADVARAHAEQTKLYQRVLAFFAEVDVLICPAAAVSPFPHTQLSVSEINGERMPTYMRWLALTYAPTTALCCAAAIPCGVDHAGMPFGLQVIGPNGADARVLQAAHALEQVLARDTATARPVPAVAG
ncbi:MAG TPA: amidase family protein [Hyphomicrobiaceae bacterium]|nr:amidase family protein [Hyphomicrobiaceae bacterium]